MIPIQKPIKHPMTSPVHILTLKGRGIEANPAYLLYCYEIPDKQRADPPNFIKMVIQVLKL